MWQMLFALRCLLSEIPYIRSLNWNGFKTQDLCVIEMIIKTKQMFFDRVIWSKRCKGTALFWKRGRGAAAHLHLKIHVRKQPISASTQNRHYKWSVGYFELTIHQHILGTPETYITSCRKGHNRCPFKGSSDAKFTLQVVWT